MKRCPSCQRTYTDDTLRFCLEDGMTLVSGASDPLAATLLDSPPRHTGSDRSTPTEVLQSPSTSDNQASPTRAWGTPGNAQPPFPGSWGGGQTISRPQAPPIPSPSEKVEKRSWPGAATLIIGIVTWLLVALSFISAALKLSSGLIGFLFLAGMFLGFFGILFGAVAFGLAFRSPERYGGKGLALIGLLMNLMPVLFVLLLLAIGIAVTIK